MTAIKNYSTIIHQLQIKNKDIIFGIGFKNPRDLLILYKQHFYSLFLLLYFYGEVQHKLKTIQIMKQCQEYFNKKIGAHLEKCISKCAKHSPFGHDDEDNEQPNITYQLNSNSNSNQSQSSNNPICSKMVVSQFDNEILQKKELNNDNKKVNQYLRIRKKLKQCMNLKQTQSCKCREKIKFQANIILLQYMQKQLAKNIESFDKPKNIDYLMSSNSSHIHQNFNQNPLKTTSKSPKRKLKFHNLQSREYIRKTYLIIFQTLNKLQLKSTMTFFDFAKLAGCILGISCTIKQFYDTELIQFNCELFEKKGLNVFIQISKQLQYYRYIKRVKYQGIISIGKSGIRKKQEQTAKNSQEQKEVKVQHKQQKQLTVRMSSFKKKQSSSSMQSQQKQQKGEKQQQNLQQQNLTQLMNYVFEKQMIENTDLINSFQFQFNNSSFYGLIKQQQSYIVTDSLQLNKIKSFKKKSDREEQQQKRSSATHLQMDSNIVGKTDGDEDAGEQEQEQNMDELSYDEQSFVMGGEQAKSINMTYNPNQIIKQQSQELQHTRQAKKQKLRKKSTQIQNENGGQIAEDSRRDNQEVGNTKQTYGQEMQVQQSLVFGKSELEIYHVDDHSVVQIQGKKEQKVIQENILQIQSYIDESVIQPCFYRDSIVYKPNQNVVDNLDNSDTLNILGKIQVTAINKKGNLQYQQKQLQNIFVNNQVNSDTFLCSDEQVASEDNYNKNGQIDNSSISIIQNHNHRSEMILMNRSDNQEQIQYVEYIQEDKREEEDSPDSIKGSDHVIHGCQKSKKVLVKLKPLKLSNNKHSGKTVSTNHDSIISPYSYTITNTNDNKNSQSATCIHPNHNIASTNVNANNNNVNSLTNTNIIAQNISQDHNNTSINTHPQRNNTSNSNNQQEIIYETGNSTCTCTANQEHSNPNNINTQPNQCSQHQPNIMSIIQPNDNSIVEKKWEQGDQDQQQEQELKKKLKQECEKQEYKVIHVSKTNYLDLEQMERHAKQMLENRRRQRTRRQDKTHNNDHNYVDINNSNKQSMLSEIKQSIIKNSPMFNSQHRRQTQQILSQILSLTGNSHDNADQNNQEVDISVELVNQRYQQFKRHHRIQIKCDDSHNTACQNKQINKVSPDLHAKILEKKCSVLQLQQNLENLIAGQQDQPEFKVQAQSVPKVQTHPQSEIHQQKYNLFLPVTSQQDQQYQNYLQQQSQLQGTDSMNTIPTSPPVSPIKLFRQHKEFQVKEMEVEEEEILWQDVVKSTNQSQHREHREQEVAAKKPDSSDISLMVQSKESNIKHLNYEKHAQQQQNRSKQKDSKQDNSNTQKQRHSKDDSILSQPNIVIHSPQNIQKQIYQQKQQRQQQKLENPNITNKQNSISKTVVKRGQQLQIYPNWNKINKKSRPLASSSNVLNRNIKNESYKMDQPLSTSTQINKKQFIPQPEQHNNLIKSLLLTKGLTLKQDYNLCIEDLDPNDDINTKQWITSKNKSRTSPYNQYLSVKSMKVGGGTLNNINSDALGLRNSEQNYFSYNPNSINAYRSYNNQISNFNEDDMKLVESVTQTNNQHYKLLKQLKKQNCQQLMKSDKLAVSLNYQSQKQKQGSSQVHENLGQSQDLIKRENNLNQQFISVNSQIVKRQLPLNICINKSGVCGQYPSNQNQQNLNQQSPKYQSPIKGTNAERNESRKMDGNKKSFSLNVEWKHRDLLKYYMNKQLSNSMRRKRRGSEQFQYRPSMSGQQEKQEQGMQQQQEKNTYQEEKQQQGKDKNILQIKSKEKKRTKRPKILQISNIDISKDLSLIVSKHHSINSPSCQQENNQNQINIMRSQTS